MPAPLRSLSPGSAIGSCRHGNRYPFAQSFSIIVPPNDSGNDPAEIRPPVELASRALFLRRRAASSFLGPDRR